MPSKPLHFSGKIVVRKQDGRRLVIQRSRKSRGNPGQWEFPGGKADEGEHVDAALLREVGEETGIAIHLGKIVGHAHSELTDKTIAYLFFDAQFVSGEVRLSDEHEDSRWVSLPELLEMNARKEIAEQFRPFVEAYCRARGYGQMKREDSPAPRSAARIDEFVARYQAEHPVYESFAATLEKNLRDAMRQICPEAIVQCRPKSVASFAEKILRKNKYNDPLADITDLCGARIITQIKPEVDAVCEFIRTSFAIDEANSVDTLTRLRASEFGYRSVHFVVRFDAEGFRQAPHRLLRPKAGTKGEMRAEIQVRTILQHAWAAIGHDRLYKSGFAVPDVHQREAGRVAAVLESADDAFGRIVDGMENYRTNSGAMPKTDGEFESEQAICRTILSHQAGDSAASESSVHRLARLSMLRNQWADAVRVLREFPGTGKSSSLECCLGISLCELHRDEPSHPAFAEGREALRRAIQLDGGNIEALLQFAETASDETEKLGHFQAAFVANPGDPEVLSAYVRHKLGVEKSDSFIPLLRPALEQAIATCRLHVQAGVNLPEALLRIAGFHLLLGPVRDAAGREDCAPALTACAQAAALAKAPLLLKTASEAVEKLRSMQPGRCDLKAVSRFLLAAWRARFPKDAPLERLTRIATHDEAGQMCRIEGPVVIIAGGCDPAHAGRVAGYRALLHECLADFKGTIVSGGTREGISGLVAELGERHPGRLRTVGYLPAMLPSDGTATRDGRYHDLRRTDGDAGFSVLEPIQNWIDLLASGIAPEDVRVIGINGGAIAALEYRMAWALGARVGIVRGSGREADRIEHEINGQEYPGMLLLPEDAMTLRAFIHTGDRRGSPFTAEQAERLARLAHARYLDQNRHRLGDRTMRDWDFLGEDLKRSNLDQITYMTQILRAVGCGVATAGSGAAPGKFSSEESETMGRMEHGRWNVERLSQGWRWGEKREPEKRLSPFLVSWNDLDDGVKGWDRSVVDTFQDLLAEIGMQIVREPATAARPDTENSERTHP